MARTIPLGAICKTKAVMRPKVVQPIEFRLGSNPELSQE